MISCKYSGTWSDSSGYGQANRDFINALFIAGVNVTTELVVQMPEKTNYGIAEATCKSLSDRNINYKIKIIHLTPDCYPRYMEQGKYHIGHLFWETDRLPQTWIDPCNLMNEIWTASEKQATMIKKSGVKCPLYWFPQPNNTIKGEEYITPFEMKYKKDFIFYSIFQWIDRKNPRALLRSYWKAFEGKEDVTLLLKTYRVNYSPDEFAKIITDIQQWKKELGQQHCPKVFITRKLLQDTEMNKLHALGDVYVNPSSGEGWCKPLAEAMLFGKPVISADNGGITDYLTNDHYFRIPSVPQHVKEATWIPWYTQNMYWWEIKEDDLTNMMRHVYENRGEIPNKVNKAKQFIMDKFSFQTVGNMMKERLTAIDKIL